MEIEFQKIFYLLAVYGNWKCWSIQFFFFFFFLDDHKGRHFQEHNQTLKNYFHWTKHSLSIPCFRVNYIFGPWYFWNMFDFRHSSLKSLDLTFKFSKTRALIPLICSWYIYIYIYGACSFIFFFFLIRYMPLVLEYEVGLILVSKEWGVLASRIHVTKKLDIEKGIE